MNPINDDADRIGVGDRVRILRPLTVVNLHGKVVTVARDSSRPFGVLLRDLTFILLAADEVEWEKGQW